MSSFLRCRLSARYLLSRMYPLQRVFTCFLVPIILSPIPLLIGTKEADCAYVVLIMAYFWLNDSATLPLAVTALIPTFAFPLFAIETANDVAHTYLSDANFIFFGSMVMAVAVEASQLHERIALKTLLFTGPNPRWLMLGFQVATAFLSMWTSNTATTMMMVPIVLAVIRELDLCQRKQNDPEAGYFSNDNEEILDLDNVPEKHLKIYKGLLLSICFAATIGGTGTLIGAGTTVLLNAFLQKHYHHQSPVSFGSYMIYAIPQVIIMIIVCWLWLQFLYIGFRKHDDTNDEVIKHILVKKHQNLGPLKYEEKTILITFGILIILWLTRQPVIFPGWGNFFPRKYVTDGTAAMFVSTLLFILPADNPFLAETVDELKPGQQIRTVMTWKLMRDRFSWSTLFLLGGGFAMASGVSSSGLSDWMAMRLTTLQQLPNWVFISVACALVTFLTEFTSNVATASIFIPMVSSFAKTQGVDPILFVIPITFSATFAFMFPAGTPPNAIVFGYKILRVSDMVIGGVVLNIFGFIMCQTMVHTYAYAIFDLKDQIAVNRTLSAIITH